MDFKCDELISEKTDADSRALTDFSLKNVSSVNYYELYQDFISKLIALETSYILGGFSTQTSRKNDFTNTELSSSQENKVDRFDKPLFKEMSNQEKTRLLKELALLEGELNNIRNKIKKEVQMNEKLRLNVQARKIKHAILAITSQLA